MGNLRRLKKQINAPMAMADAHISVNGCRIFLGHLSAKQASAAAVGFKEMFTKTLIRSQCPNMYDILTASLAVKKCLDENKPIWN